MLNPIKNKKLLKRGAPVRARILEMSERTPGKEAHATRMTLEVEFRGETYTLRDRFMVPGDEPLKVGSELWLVVDPYDRQKAAIAWERTREDYRARTAERRQLATGLAVPVTKVREVTVGPTPKNVPRIPQEFRGTQTLEPTPTVMIGAYGTAGEEQAPSSRHERDLLAEHPPAPAVRRPLAALPDPTPIRPVVPPARSAPPPATGDLASQLERLASLRDVGALTETEFAAAKAQILSGAAAAISSSSS